MTDGKSWTTALRCGFAFNSAIATCPTLPPRSQKVASCATVDQGYTAKCKIGERRLVD